MTRLLTRSDLTGLLDIGDCLNALREGFTRYESVEVGGQRIRTDLPFPGTATALLPGLLPGIPAFTLKVNAKFPGADPALRGTICLHDGRDGALLALADSATITAWRTGLAAALATDLLAADSSTVGVIGAGAQSALMVRGLVGLRDIDRLVVCDRNAAAAREFVTRFAESGIDGTVVVTPQEVAAVSDVVLVATWSREVLLDLVDVPAGQHITSVGSDEPGKQELGAALLEVSTVVVDDRELAARMGALANAGLPARAAAATVGEVCRGEHAGRIADHERTVYAPVGLPWQDLCLTWFAFRQSERDGRGSVVDLLS